MVYIQSTEINGSRIWSDNRKKIFMGNIDETFNGRSTVIFYNSDRYNWVELALNGEKAVDATLKYGKMNGCVVLFCSVFNQCILRNTD